MDRHHHQYGDGDYRSRSRPDYHHKASRHQQQYSHYDERHGNVEYGSHGSWQPESSRSQHRSRDRHHSHHRHRDERSGRRRSPPERRRRSRSSSSDRSHRRERSGRRTRRDRRSQSSGRRDDSGDRCADAPTIVEPPVSRVCRSPSPNSVNPSAPPMPNGEQRRPDAGKPNLRYYAESPDNDLDGDEIVDKELIHQQMEDRLKRHLAREGIVYPPPKPQASHPIFANDGSFLETFKRLQETQQADNAAARAAAAAARAPLFGRRRGGKILKTGVVAKPRVADDDDERSEKGDAWSMYMQEVKKYKGATCDTDPNTRPLVK